MSTIIRKTYTAGALDIATLVTTNGFGSINWLLNDHLGSTAITVRANGTKSAELRYSAFGETRYTSGTTPTDYRYTGQLQQGAVNLYYYNARWYDPKLARFTQADTIIPSPADPQSWDRYAYVKNNPVRYTDPSGRYYEEEGPGRKNNTSKPPPNIINFSGNGWTMEAKNNINNAANMYGWRLLPYAIRQMQLFSHLGVYEGQLNLKNGAQAFILIFGNVEFLSHTNSCAEYFTKLGDEGAETFKCYGCAAGSQTVFKFKNASMEDLTSEWAGHEIAHLFDLHIGLQGRNSITKDLAGSLKGMVSGKGMIQNQSLVTHEIFANMMDSWVFNIWDTGKDGFARKSLMDSNMASWVSLAILGNH